MASPNLNMRDPVFTELFIRNIPKLEIKWKIYPSYDFAHGQSDSLEGITHSLCTLEFEHHRPLYDWFCQNLKFTIPSKLNLHGLILITPCMSKRKMLRLVEEGHVSGWDDPTNAYPDRACATGFHPKVHT